MRQSGLALASLLSIALTAPAHAGDGKALATGAKAAEPAATAPRMALGPNVISPSGQPGRLHTVAAGETLWDISEAYLGTPWVWSSIWKDDSDSGRDAMIRPGDVLFVSSTEIRRLTPEEVAQVRAEAPGGMPAAMDTSPGGNSGGVSMGNPLGLDHWTALQGTGFVTVGRMLALGEVIGSGTPTPRAVLATGDPIFIDMGAGAAQVGDRLRIVRRQHNVPDPDTGRLIGTFVEPLGWARVTQVESEASVAVIEGAVTEVMAGDLLLPADGSSDPAAFALSSTPASVRGELIHMVGERVISGGMDVVYIDHGNDAGLSPGSALEVVRPGGMFYDAGRQRTVKVPDTIIGQLVVISTQPSSSAAFVLKATTDLMRGDYYRGADVR